MEQRIASIRKLNFEILESSLSTLVGMPAYQIVYIENGVKILAVVTTKGNKAFAICVRDPTTNLIKGYLKPYRLLPLL